MGNDTKYFNFPITLLNGFMMETTESLNKILYYSLYAHAQKLELGDETDRVRAAEHYYGVSLGNFDRALRIGKELYNSIDIKAPKVGINKDIYFDFYKNDKSEFEKACLLAHLAIKSIVQNKAYCKITNLFLLSRMDGNSHSVAEKYELSDDIIKYANEYQLKKIKYELVDNWNLKTYARYTRGFYVSFSLEYKELVYQAEKRRKSTKIKQLKKKQDEALKAALHRLDNDH